MPDEIFDDPRLVAGYDIFDGERDDLDHYRAIIDELGARSVLDIGCGTGTLASSLAVAGLDVVGVDPASASLDIARTKPGADRIRFIHGTAPDLPDLDVDLALMTGNVAQVFLDDDEWATTLEATHRALRPGGHLVFEVRDPAAQGWLAWTDEASRATKFVPSIGELEAWVEVTDVSMPFVTFVWTFHFLDSGDTLTSTSTLRFRERAEIDRQLRAQGFDVVDVRDAPDRPGLELVFIARR